MEELPSQIHYLSDHTGACFQCGKQTGWIDLTFEAWLCPGECAERAWEQFNAMWGASIDGTSAAEDDPFTDPTMAPKET